MSEPKISTEERCKLEALARQFKNNDYDIVVLDSGGMVALWYAARMQEGASPAKARTELQASLGEWGLSEIWEQVRDVAAKGAAYTATALDTRLLLKLAQDLGRSGSVLTKYRIAKYNGRDFIIFRGNHRARQLINGSRYLASNTRLVSLGVGKLGTAKAVTDGVKLTLVLMITFRAIDTLLSEEATWHTFVGAAAADIVKVGASGAASYIIATAVAGGAAAGAIAVGPLFVAIVVGATVGYGLDRLDEQLGFTQALVQGLREADASFRRELRKVKREWDWHNRNPAAQVQFWMRVFGARYY